jgi:hypothetical protein
MSLAGVLQARTRPRASRWGERAHLAEGSAGDCCFRGLARGLYSLKAGGKEWALLVNGDVEMDWQARLRLRETGRR